VPNKLYDALVQIEKELPDLDKRGRHRNPFGVLSRGSGLHVLRSDGVVGFSGWEQTSTSKDNPHEDRARCDVLIESAAEIARLGGTGTPRERFLASAQ